MYKKISGGIVTEQTAKTNNINKINNKRRRKKWQT